MKLLGQLLLIALAVSAVQGLLALFAVALLLVLLIGLLVRPREAWAVVAFLGLLKALGVNAPATVALIGTVLAAVWVIDRAELRRVAGEKPSADQPKRLTGPEL